jgi:aspartyl-tRNA synthetase
MAVQVDPIKPMLKAPGSERLKLKCDDMLSNFAFNFNLRRFISGIRRFLEDRAFLEMETPVLHAEVRRCRLTL